MILFLSIFPYGKECADGASQRIIQIDRILENENKIYFGLSLHKYLLPKIKISKNRTEFRANIMWSFLLIPYLLLSKYIYLHSIFSVFRCRILFKIFATNKIILDIHGIVPEELEYCGEINKSRKFTQIEKLVISKSICLIGVTQKMLDYMVSKYNSKHIKVILLPMLTYDIELLKKDTDCPNDRQYDIIYAGGVQKWQNLDILANIVNSLPELKYALFVSHPEKISELFQKKWLLRNVTHDVVINTLKQSSLGFICRDNHILNVVSCPTKLIEYIVFGVVPVVQNKHLGDFYDLGYEFFCCDDILENGFPEQSLIKEKQERNFIVLSKLKQVIFDGEIKLRQYVGC